MNEHLNLISKIDLFSNLNSQDIIDLFDINLYSVKNYKKDSIIFLKNELCTSCSVILKGSILIQDVDINGNVLTLNEFSTGDVFGENLLFSSANSYPMNVISKTDTLILNVKKELIIKICQSNDGFFNDFLESVSNKTIILKDKVQKLSIKTIRECIIDFLLYQHRFQNSNIIKLDRTKKELAEEFGIQRTSFSRELNKMRKEGLINFDSKTITIIDLDMLIR